VVFGAVRTDVGSISQTDYGYTGQRNLDSGIGLMDYKARFYSPYLNRFIQPDTIVPSPTNPQAWNKYSYTENNPIKYIDPTGHWVETAFDVISLGMTINDIKNEGFTFWNTVSLVTDVASIVLPAVPAGASHLIRAAKYADKATDTKNAVQALSKLDELGDVYKVAVHNAKSKVAVLGSWIENSALSYERIGEKFKSTYMYLDNYDEFIKKYGRDAFRDYINIPFVQKEVIDKKKTVLFTTPIDEILKLREKDSLLRVEYNLLVKAGYQPVNNRMMIPM
jgi:RHS repeat-associated protein